jgi:hypothetical protein
MLIIPQGVSEQPDHSTHMPEYHAAADCKQAPVLHNIFFAHKIKFHLDFVSKLNYYWVYAMIMT